MATQYIQKQERKVAIKNAIDKPKAEKECRKKCGKDNKGTQVPLLSDGVVLLLVVMKKNICVIPTYPFGHPVRAGGAQKRVHKACFAKLIQLQRNTALA